MLVQFQPLSLNTLLTIMNNEIKILLTIELEGGTLVRKSEPEIIKYQVTERDYDNTKKWRGSDGKKVLKKGSFKHYSFETKPASKHINITQEAYSYMTSSECPYWVKPKVWGHMTAKERLENHLQRMCEHFNGKSFTYEVLKD